MPIAKKNAKIMKVVFFWTFSNPRKESSVHLVVSYIVMYHISKTNIIFKTI